jgi:hypothetical protein
MTASDRSAALTGVGIAVDVMPVHREPLTVTRLATLRKLELKSESRHEVPGDRRNSDPAPCSCALEHSCAPVDVYNEEAFRYFLDVERQRAEISNRSFLLLLLDLNKTPPTGDEINKESADRLFMALATALRETDFLGWYRACSIIGAVLTQHSDSASLEVERAVRDRIVHLVRDQLPSQLSQRVQLRVYRLPGTVRGV